MHLSRMQVPCATLTGRVRAFRGTYASSISNSSAAYKDELYYNMTNTGFMWVSVSVFYLILRD